MKNRWKYAVAVSAFAGLLFFGHPGDAWAEENTADVQQIEQTSDQQSAASDEESAEVLVTGTDETDSTDVQEPETDGTDVQEPETDSTDVQEPETDSTDVQEPETDSTDVQEPETDGTDVQESSTDSTDVQEPAADTADTAAADTAQAPAKAMKTASAPATSTGFVKTIDDGVYVISSALNGFKVLDVAGGSTKNGGNVQLYEANGTTAQKYQVTWNEDGYYTIKNINSNKYLDADGGGTANGTNVQQYAGNGTDAQKWFIVRKDNGFFEILNKLSQKAVDIRWGEQNNGTNVWLYSENGSDSQLFKFIEAADNVAITNGVYEITTKLDQNKALDISGGSMYSGGNLQIYDYNGSGAQQFIVTEMSDGTYRLTSLNSGMTLDLTYGSAASGTNIRQYANNNTASQKWYIRQAGDGTCYIVPALAAGNAVDVCGGNTANSTNVWSYTQNGSDSQRFYFSRVDYQPLNGEFIIASAVDNNMVLDIAGGSRKVQANLQLYSSNGTLAQKFIIQDNGDGYVTIKNANSGHVLDVIYGSLKNRSNVRQYQNNGTLAQKWIEHLNEDGTISFINANSSKVLDVRFGEMSDGTNIWQYGWNNSDSQKFELIRTTGTNTDPIDYSVESLSSDTADRRVYGLSSDTDYAIVVNCSAHEVSVYEGGEGCWNRIYRWSCGDGYYTPTPKGSFKIFSREVSFDDQWGYTCWYATHFYDIYMLHSVVYAHHSQSQIIDGRLGQQVSHGCVRLELKNAKWIYDNCANGTLVHCF